MKHDKSLTPGTEITARLSDQPTHLWYESLNRICSELGRLHNVPLATVAGVLVTFSAQKKFSENLNQTVQFLSGVPIQGMYSKKQLETAKAIMAGADPLLTWNKESLKYRNFYESILLTPGAVCVDSHIIKHYLAKHPYSKLHKKPVESIFGAPRAYRLIQEYVRKFARSMGMESYQAQAYLWVLQRGNMW